MKTLGLFDTLTGVLFAWLWVLSLAYLMPREGSSKLLYCVLVIAMLFMWGILYHY
ncbi:hypothetical protein LCGC14_2524520 [marine sediment metagenome]|uniref:Uncharacterized protein n=1 Tax=marine sediment metagenome TaxID=412755 RepID=A0A0F9BI96_9ZZZZ